MVRGTTPSYALLDRPVYEVAEAARLIGAAGSTLRWWLQGRRFRGRQYLPVLRDAPNEDVVVRWGEFIEAAILRFLRQDRRISLGELRAFRVMVQERHPDVRHPLATDRLYVNGGRLAFQELAGFWEPSTGTVFDETAASAFFERCQWQDHVAVSFRPSDAQPRVRLRPDVQFGAPQVRGIRTAAIFNLHAAGEASQLIAEDLAMELAEVEEAIAFERILRSGRAA